MLQLYDPFIGLQSILHTADEVENLNANLMMSHPCLSSLSRDVRTARPGCFMWHTHYTHIVLALVTLLHALCPPVLSVQFVYYVMLWLSALSLHTVFLMLSGHSSLSPDVAFTQGGLFL